MCSDGVSLVGMRWLLLGCTLRPLRKVEEAKSMLRTRLCELLGIDHPVIQASIGPWSSAELVAAVSNAGGLGSVGTSLWSPEDVREQILRVRELTDRPFAVNHVVRPFNEEIFALTLEAEPKVISLALGDPGDLVERAHDAGILFMQQVHTVEQSRRAAEKGVDMIIAQGSEAGGFGSTVSTMSLLPQVVDAVSPIPVVAAGGIADGRGLAATLVLGAQGVNIGTRFLASEEAAIDDEWKQRIVAAESEDAVKVEFADHVFPAPNREGGYGTLPRVLRTAFVEEWNRRQDEAEREAERLSDELLTAVRQGQAHELVPFTGQTTGMIRDTLPAGEIVHELVREAEETLRIAASLLQ
jgi:enoyl-[acyl-carrier protein] reductase II